MRRWLPLLLLVCGCQGANHRATLPSGSLSASLLSDLHLETPQSARDAVTVLTTANPDGAHSLLWDARLGVNLSPYGFSDADDSAFVADGYDAKEDLRPTNPPLAADITFNQTPVQPGQEGYGESLDLRYGLLTVHWFAPISGGYLEARLSAFVKDGALLCRWDFHGPPGGKLSIRTQSVAGRLSTTGFLGAGFHPDTATPLSDGPFQTALDRSGNATWLVESREGEARSFPPLGPELKTCKARLDAPTSPRIVVDGPIEDQQAIASFLYYLRAAGLGASAGSSPSRFSPFMLSSDRYNGHVFWDADVWLMPALAFVEPGLVKDLATYRASHMQAAPMAPFPWESAVSGKEVAPGASKKEIHISGSVLWGLELASALGAKVPDDIQKRVADYYLARSTRRADGTLGLLDVMSPDETHVGANDLYTNLLAQWALNGASWTPKSSSAPTMYLPSDKQGLITYDNDSFRGYKQAAAVLSIFPLQYPAAEANARKMLERFEGKVIPNGPAMTDSVHATIWARLDVPSKAYADWEKSWRDFIKGPLFLFSEKRSTPTTYFTTGAAGCLQTVIYGFMGFRVGERPEPGASWSLNLQNGRRLSISPHLPPNWNGVTFQNFRVLGRTYTLSVKREGPKTVTSIQQGV